MTQLWSSEELASHEFPEPTYLVRPMIPLGGIFILHGKPNVGKTQLILTMAHAINNGLPLFGRWPTREGPVVVIQADMTGPIQQVRVQKVISEIDIASTYWVVEEDGAAPLIDITTMRMTKAELVRQIREIDPVLVVWDTLRKIHRLPENASESPIIVYQKATKLFPRATHGFVHHNRKEDRDPDSDSHADESFMGNQQWWAAADASFSLAELGASPKRVILTFHKARTAPDTEKEPFLLELDMQSMLLCPTRARHREEVRGRDDLLVTGRAARAEARRLGLGT